MASARSLRAHQDAKPHRQVRPAVAEQISVSVRRHLARKEAQQAANLAAVAAAGIRIAGEAPTENEIRRARQKLARKEFTAAGMTTLSAD
jgi:hypothetical protein